MLGEELLWVAKPTRGQRVPAPPATAGALASQCPHFASNQCAGLETVCFGVVCAISCCFLNACVPSLHSLLDTQHLPRKPIRQCWTTGSKLCKYPSTDTGGPSPLFCMCCSLFSRRCTASLQPLARQPAQPRPTQAFSHTFPPRVIQNVPAASASIWGVEEEGFHARTAFAVAGEGAAGKADGQSAGR